MRRVLVLLVVAAAVAVGAGLAVPSSALSVNSTSVSTAQLNREMAAIDASPSWQCYLQAQAFNDRATVPTTVAGVPTQAWATTTTVEWLNDRTTDLAVIQYVQAHDPAALAPPALPAARRSLASAITSTIQEAYTNASSRGEQFSCTAPKLGGPTLASMPAWFQDQEVAAEAAVLALVGLLPGSLPESGPALEAWYARHQHAFDTVCVSYIVTVDQATAETVLAKIDAGLPFAAAAKRYSKDPSTAPHGGALGCFSPTSSAYPTVRTFVGSVPTHGVSAVTPNPSGEGWLLFTVTKRTTNSFASIKRAVEAEVTSANQSSAELFATAIQRRAAVKVSSAVGSYEPTSLGGTIVPPASPPPSAVLNASANTPG